MSGGPNDNWLLRSFYVCLIASVLAFVVTYALNELGVDVKVFNPLSDLMANDDREVSDIDEPYTIAVDSVIAGQLPLDTLGYESVLEGDSTIEINEEENSPTWKEPIETSSPLVDFSADQDAKSRFIGLLENAINTPLYIAFIGDSFIEGDIFVGDFRHLLQKNYGGAGVGYVPVTSPTARFRTSIKHQFDGDWKSQTMLHQGVYTLTGHWDCLDGEGRVSYTIPSKSTNAGGVAFMKMVYESDAPSIVTTIINDSVVLSKELQPTGLGALALLNEQYSGIKTIAIEAKSKHLNIHGVYLDALSGVSVDNMSTRGASGGELVRIADSLIDKMRGIRDYQVIILSFGLNAVAEGEDNDTYHWYYSKMKRSIQHLKRLYPDAIILVMSVSDRATLEDGKAKTLNGVNRIRRHQYNIAKEEGCLFWDTFSVMKEMGGMESFVQKGWAAKDYTHISSAGGRELAKSLYQSLVEE